MNKPNRNYGLAGGFTKPKTQCYAASLAFQLRIGSSRDGCEERWSDDQARMYLELGFIQIEYHANWGV
jgi:hypothetical protein